MAPRLTSSSRPGGTTTPALAPAPGLEHTGAHAAFRRDLARAGTAAGTTPPLTVLPAQGAFCEVVVGSGSKLCSFRDGFTVRWRADSRPLRTSGNNPR